MFTYQVMVGGTSRTKGRFSNTYFETVRANNAADAKRKAIAILKRQHVNLPGRTYKDTLAWTRAMRVRPM